MTVHNSSIKDSPDESIVQPHQNENHGDFQEERNKLFTQQKNVIQNDIFK